MLYDPRNLARFEEHGVGIIPGFFSREPQKELEAIKASTIQELESALAKKIAGSSHTRFILSQESYAILEPEQVAKVKRALDPMGSRILAYLRRQDEMVESSWRQWLVKEMTWDQCYERIVSDPISFMTRLDPWIEEFGKENVFISSYNDLKDKGLLVTDFFERVGLKAEDLELPDDKVNKALPRTCLEMVNISKDLLEDKHDNRINRIYTQFGDLDDLVDHELMTYEQRVELWERCRLENERIKRDFLKEGEEIFRYPKSKDRPKFSGLEIEEVVNFLNKIILAQDEKLRSQKPGKSDVGTVKTELKRLLSAMKKSMKGR